MSKLSAFLAQDSSIAQRKEMYPLKLGEMPYPMLSFRYRYVFETSLDMFQKISFMLTCPYKCTQKYTLPIKSLNHPETGKAHVLHHSGMASGIMLRTG